MIHTRQPADFSVHSQHTGDARNTPDLAREISEIERAAMAADRDAARSVARLLATIIANLGRSAV